MPRASTSSLCAATATCTLLKLREVSGFLKPSLTFAASSVLQSLAAGSLLALDGGGHVGRMPAPAAVSRRAGSYAHGAMPAALPAATCHSKLRRCSTKNSNVRARLPPLFAVRRGACVWRARLRQRAGQHLGMCGVLFCWLRAGALPRRLSLRLAHACTRAPAPTLTRVLPPPGHGSARAGAR